MKNLNNTGQTLLEVLLAAVIFVVSVAGIFATLNAVRVPVTNKESQLAAAVFGKQVLEALRSQVTAGGATPYYSGCFHPVEPVGTVASPCTDFSLSVGVHQVSTATLLASGGLSWPSTSTDLVTANGGANSEVLKYTVSCGDTGLDTDGTCSGNLSTAHRVDLYIQW